MSPIIFSDLFPYIYAQLNTSACFLCVNCLLISVACCNVHYALQDQTYTVYYHIVNKLFKLIETDEITMTSMAV